MTQNKITANKLASNKLASNKLASNKLASNALSTNRLTANPATDDLLQTADGREVYSYIVSCALNAGTTIEADVATAPDDEFCTAGHCTFPGAIGLATTWATHSLDASGQRWISSCLFARCNAHDTSEPISMRGSHPALAVDPGERVDFPLQEGAFFGNFFLGDGDDDCDDDDGHGHHGHERGHGHEHCDHGHHVGDKHGHHGDNDTPTEIQWYACRGSDQAAGEFGGLVGRDCAEPDPVDPTHTQCGFIFAGDCADYTPVFPSPFACDTFDVAGTFYGSCHTQPGGGTTFAEVITTYVGP